LGAERSMDEKARTEVRELFSFVLLTCPHASGRGGQNAA
jgi:hypothetical protein